MPRIKSKQFETFTDGVLSICNVEERTITYTKLKGIRFGNRTIGERRYFDTQTAGNKLSKLLSIPAEVLNRENIEVLDVVVIDSQSGWLWDPFDFERDEIDEHNPAQYKIVQIQEKFDATPPAVYLSLEKIVQLYTDRRPDCEQ